MTTTTNISIPATSLSIAQSIAKIETKAEFKSFMVATFNYDKKLSTSQIVREYSAKTGFEVEDTDDFKAVLSNIAKDSDINTLPKTSQTLPNVEQKDIDPQLEAKTKTPNTKGSDAKDDEKELEKIAFQKRCEACKGEIKQTSFNFERVQLALKHSPLYAECAKTPKDTAFKGMKALIYQLHELGFTNKDISLFCIYDFENDEKLTMGSITDAILKTKQDLGILDKKPRGEGAGEVSEKGKKAKEVAEAKAAEIAAYQATAAGMREKIDAKKERILTLQAEILEDEKAYTLQVEKEANEAKEAVKQTLSNNVANMKNAGLSVEDMLAQIEAMKAMINAMNA